MKQFYKNKTFFFFLPKFVPNDIVFFRIENYWEISKFVCQGVHVTCKHNTYITHSLLKRAKEL